MVISGAEEGKCNQAGWPSGLLNHVWNAMFCFSIWEEHTYFFQPQLFQIHTHTHTQPQCNCFVLYYVPFLEVTSHLVRRNPPNLRTPTKVASPFTEIHSLHTIFILHCCAGHLTFFFWPRQAACGILAPWTGVEPVPPAVEAWSPNHWTIREFPGHLIFKGRWGHFCKVEFPMKRQTQHMQKRGLE